MTLALFNMALAHAVSSVIGLVLEAKVASVTVIFNGLPTVLGPFVVASAGIVYSETSCVSAGNFAGGAILLLVLHCLLLSCHNSRPLFLVVGLLTSYVLVRGIGTQFLAS